MTAVGTPAVKNERLRTSALSLVYEQSYIAHLAIFLNATIYIYLSWDLVSHRALVIWGALIYLTSFVRLLYQWRWARRKDSLTLNSFERPLKVGVAISGCLWGAMGSILLVPGSSIHLALTTFILAGMTAGVVGAYASILQVVDLYLYLSLGPFAGRLFFEMQREYLWMGVMACLYLVSMTLISRNLNRRTLRAFEIGFENEDLVNKLNDASHEIRTPVTAIAGYAEFLQDPSGSPDEIHKIAGIIQRNSVYLKRLVDNILMLSRAGAGQLEGHRERISVADEIDGAVSLVESQLKEKNLQLIVDISPEVPGQIYLDTLRFQQILINLLANSIKFTNKGEIRISAFLKAGGNLALRIADTGIGVDPADREKLFRPFYRESRQEVKSQEGSGLGLTLARALARSLGGDLCLVDSQLGKGSVFEFEVSLEWPADESPGRRRWAVPTRVDLSGARILLVDDSEDMRMLYKRCLEKDGAMVEVCSCGPDAVQRVAENPDFDLILLDIDMPEMDGYEALKQIRQCGFTRPVLALSAYSLSVKKGSFVEAGFDASLGKAVNLKEFGSLVAKWVRRPLV